MPGARLWLHAVGRSRAGDPEFEERHQTWAAGGRTEREPEKVHFVKRFHRGLELFGVERLREEGRPEQIRKLGLILVEGPNDVIRLDTLGVPSVALCSNLITREQAAKAAALAKELSNGMVTVFLDCDEEGLKCADSGRAPPGPAAGPLPTPRRAATAPGAALTAQFYRMAINFIR